MPSLESLLERLIQNDVEFVVVGGFAAFAHGVSLLTQDIDICCRFTPENLLKLQESLSDLHPIHRMTPKRLALKLNAANCTGLKNLYLDTDYGQLDCLSEVLAIGEYEEVLQQSVAVHLPFGQVRVLGLDALIKAKKAMNRPRDRETAEQLEEIRRSRETSGKPGKVREKRPSYGGRKRSRPPDTDR